MSIYVIWHREHPMRKLFPCEERLIFCGAKIDQRIGYLLATRFDLYEISTQIYGQSNYLTSSLHICCIFLANWTSIYTTNRHMYYYKSKDPFISKTYFSWTFFHFQTKKAQQIAGSPVSKRIWICLCRCFKDLKLDKFKFYYKSKFLLHSNQGTYFFLFSPR